ncbi:hypothetical protein RINTU1_16610 [Candidatus Regiella insecticola]|uniref:Uncharacterized protein n=1 Tax=Candidatus Regiella insecticola TaxID=138073 RepID=A0A6L2ZN03_9ENTR|nr:hypothetical protein RINTU1_16610 [Candidatus Regiella insecticola]
MAEIFPCVFSYKAESDNGYFASDRESAIVAIFGLVTI